MSITEKRIPRMSAKVADEITGFVVGRVIEQVTDEPSWGNVTFTWDDDGPDELKAILNEIPWGTQSSYVRSFPIQYVPAAVEALEALKQDIQQECTQASMEVHMEILAELFNQCDANVDRTRGIGYKHEWWL